MSTSSESHLAQRAAFIGHGSPMNTLETNRYTDAWRAFGQAGPRPRAIVCVSAHWFIGHSAVTAMDRPRVIHDFYGFPDELFAFDYPAPGAPDVAERVAELAKPTWVGLDADSWGLDHGTWSVLAHMFPEADIPVVQLSIDSSKDADYHFELGASLAPLLDDDVMVIGSGNIVHNLRAMDWNNADGAYDWAQRFDDRATEILLDRPADVVTLRDHPDYANAVPTPDHFLPMVYLAGIAEARSTTPALLIDGTTYGSVSMTSFSV